MVEYKEIKAALFGIVSKDFNPRHYPSEYLHPPCEVTLVGVIKYGSTHDWKGICDIVLRFVRGKLLESPSLGKFSSSEVSEGTGLEPFQVRTAFYLVTTLGYFWSGWVGRPYLADDVGISEDSFNKIYQYTDMDSLIAAFLAEYSSRNNPIVKQEPVRTRRIQKISGTDIGWQGIESDYQVSRRVLVKRIAFVQSDFSRKILLRDIEGAYHLASRYPKSSVILAGSVMEELLRLYLIHRNVALGGNTFDAYLRACERCGLIKRAIHHLADSVRNFRNLIHLEKEVSARHSISIATAKGAVAAIFTLINDFEN